MSNATPRPDNGEEHEELFIPFRLLNDAARDHRFDLSSDDLPNVLVNSIDNIAVDIFDEHSGNVIVLGHERAGKTFLVEQLIGNQQKYTTTEYFFVEVLEADLGTILSLEDSFNTYAEAIAEELDISPSRVVFVTGNSAIATSFANSSSPRKMIFEAQIGAYQKIVTDESTYENGVWSKWNAVDANEIYLEKDELIQMLLKTQKKTNTNPPTKAQVKSLVEKIIQRRPSVCQNKSKVTAPPGLFAVILRRASRLMKHTNNTNFKTASGNPSWSKISHDVIEEFLDIFDPFSIEGEQDSLGEQIQNLVNDILNGGGADGTVPSQIIISSGALPEHLENPAVQPVNNRTTLHWSDMTTLEDRLNAKVHGQEEAVHRIVSELSVSATGLNDERKPLGSFILLGPTGVGKTMLAQTLADELMEEKMNMLRLDMSEYSQHFEAAKLFGVPAGYVGFDEGGILTNTVKENPRTLILLDEAEKAHHLVWDSFLQVLDAGRMTTATGEVVDFSQTVIIMTSNLGSDAMQRGASGFTPMGSVNSTSAKKDRQAIGMAEMKKYFRKEFINRIDAVITVNNIDNNSARSIMLEELRQIFVRAGMQLKPVDNHVLEHLLKKSNIHEYGARDIQRTVRQEISVKLSKRLLTSEKDPKEPIVLSLALDDNGDIVLK